MPGDPFYRSPLWRRLCAAVARRSGGRCENPGCNKPARIVDHVISRRRGGADHVDNLRHLCIACDNAVKENERGERRGQGILPGCDASGVPTDPTHPWHGGTPTRSIIGAMGARDRPGGRVRSKFRGQ